MYRRKYLFADLLIISLMTLPRTAQTLPTGPAQHSGSSSFSDEGGPVIKTFTRMVTLEVVVKDSKGNHVTGLKPIANIHPFSSYCRKARRNMG